MVKDNSKQYWTTITELVKQSQRLDGEDFPPALTHCSSSSTTTSMSEARIEPDEKPKTSKAASASVERPSLATAVARSFDASPLSKRFRFAKIYEAVKCLSSR